MHTRHLTAGARAAVASLVVDLHHIRAAGLEATFERQDASCLRCIRCGRPPCLLLVNPHLDVKQLLEVNEHRALRHVRALVVANVLLLLAELSRKLFLLANLMRVQLALCAELAKELTLTTLELGFLGNRLLLGFQNVHERVQLVVAALLRDRLVLELGALLLQLDTRALESCSRVLKLALAAEIARLQFLVLLAHGTELLDLRCQLVLALLQALRDVSDNL
mmetsp:Transcript_15452/g.36458  ORF Transcript_15452/g.36458 Transcript_15452/m.36458 type:complete len:222 (-) Transcript_15452:1653-2318(-)